MCRALSERKRTQHFSSSSARSSLWLLTFFYFWILHHSRPPSSHSTPHLMCVVGAFRLEWWVSILPGVLIDYTNTHTHMLKHRTQNAQKATKVWSAGFITVHLCKYIYISCYLNIYRPTHITVWGGALEWNQGQLVTKQPQRGAGFQCWLICRRKDVRQGPIRWLDLATWAQVANESIPITSPPSWRQIHLH